RSMLSHEIQNRFGERVSGGCREADQNDPWRSNSSGEYEPSEVLVFGEQNAILAEGKVNEILIDRSLLERADGKHIVTIFAEDANNRKIAALVREETHLRYRAARGRIVSCAIVSAAYARAARISSMTRRGYASRRSSFAAPSASFRSRSSTGMR